MAALRRATGLLTGLAMLVLLLAESGFACAMPDMTGMGGASNGASSSALHDGGGMAGMSGMSMPSTDAPGSGEQPDDPPCRFPWAPSGCRDMAPCAPATLVATLGVPPAPGPVHDRLAAGVVIAPASIDRPPEPPPPRA